MFTALLVALSWLLVLASFVFLAMFFSLASNNFASSKTTAWFSFFSTTQSFSHVIWYHWKINWTCRSLSSWRQRINYKTKLTKVFKIMNHAILANVSTDCNVNSSSVCRDDCNNYCDVDSNSTRLLHTDNTNNRVSSDEPKSTHEPKLPLRANLFILAADSLSITCMVLPVLW